MLLSHELSDNLSFGWCCRDYFGYYKWWTQHCGMLFSLFCYVVWNSKHQKQREHCRFFLIFQGVLKGFDQATNIILDESHERVFSTKVSFRFLFFFQELCYLTKLNGCKYFILQILDSLFDLHNLAHPNVWWLVSLSGVTFMRFLWCISALDVSIFCV